MTTTAKTIAEGFAEAARLNPGVPAALDAITGSGAIANLVPHPPTKQEQLRRLERRRAELIRKLDLLEAERRLHPTQVMLVRRVAGQAATLVHSGHGKTILELPHETEPFSSDREPVRT